MYIPFSLGSVDHFSLFYWQVIFNMFQAKFSLKYTQILGNIENDHK